MCTFLHKETGKFSSVVSLQAYKTAYLYTPYTRTVEEKGPGFAHFVKVPHIPNIQAVVVVYTGYL